MFKFFIADLGEVQSLIDRGVPLNATIKTINGQPISTALHFALKNRHIADGMFECFDHFWTQNVHLKLNIFVCLRVVEDKWSADIQIEILKLLLENWKTDLEDLDLMGETALYVQFEKWRAMQWEREIIFFPENYF